MEVSVYQSRRHRLGLQLQKQGGGVAVVFTAPEVARNRDSDYPYRWDSYFYHLTGFPEPESCVVVCADESGITSTLFCRDKHEEREIWDGFRYGPVAAQARFGFDQALSIDALDEQLPKLLADRNTVMYATGHSEALDARMRAWMSAVRAQARSGVCPPDRFVDVTQVLDEMRLFKDDHELGIMQKAANISAHAHCHAMRVATPGAYEYEVEAELLYHFRHNGSEFPAYGSIVAGGANACVLHYRANNQVLKDGDLLLIDAGCELDGYASDITRTFPVNGVFSPEQKDCYEIVLNAQAAAIQATVPGNTFNDPHDAAVRVLAQGMIDLKLLKGSVDDVIERGDYRRFYMHRTSHWLGMDVHDCGDYRERGVAASQSETPPWRTLRPGMVLTVEPGLYIRPADDVPKALWNIGIRIEDDAVVTPHGCEILTHAVPKSVNDIEQMIKDMRSNGSP